MSSVLFAGFLRDILFLGTLLSIVRKKCSFTCCTGAILTFTKISLLDRIVVYMDSCGNLIVRGSVFGTVGGVVFGGTSRTSVDYCRGPRFCSGCRETARVLADNCFVTFDCDFTGIITKVVSFFSIVKLITTVSTSCLVFLLPLLFIFTIRLVGDGAVCGHSLRVAAGGQVGTCTREALFLGSCTGSVHASGVFSIVVGEFSHTISSGVTVLGECNAGLFLCDVLDSLLNRFVPVVKACTCTKCRFTMAEGLRVSNFSIILSSVGSIHRTTGEVTGNFSRLSTTTLCFRGLRSFFSCRARVGSNDGGTNRFRDLRFGGIYFGCPTTGGCSLRGLDFGVAGNRAITIINVGNTKGAALIGLVLHFCSPGSNRVLCGNVGLGRCRLRDLHKGFTAIFRSCGGFTLSMGRGVVYHRYLPRSRVLTRRTLGQDNTCNGIDALPRNTGAILAHRFSRGNTNLSNKRTRGATITEVFTHSFSVTILSRPSSTLSPVTRCGVCRGLVRTAGGGAIVCVSRELSDTILSSGVVIVRGNAITRDNARTRLATTNKRCTGVFTLRTSDCGGRRRW